jgi:hypothetical protein
MLDTLSKKQQITRLQEKTFKLQDTILDNKHYIRLAKDDETLRISEYQYNKTRKLIVSHSGKRALKDNALKIYHSMSKKRVVVPFKMITK